MIKKIMAIALTLSLVLSFAVIPVHAEAFSEENWTQYYNSLKNQAGNNEMTVIDTIEVGEKTYNTHVKTVGTSKTGLSSNRTPLWYQALNRGTSPKYSHLCLYVGAYEDDDRTAMDKMWIRRCYEEGGASVESFALCDSGRVYPNGSGDLKVENFNTDFWALRSDKDADEWYKLDMIFDHAGIDKSNGTGMMYLFIDGRYVGCSYEDSKKKNLLDFFGVQFRWNKDTNINENTTIEAKFAEGREGHREYYDTDEYVVTLEDVLQDAGLGDEIDSTMIYKTSNMDWYIPDADAKRTLYYTAKEDSANYSRTLNENVTFAGDMATIAYESQTEDWELVADLLAFYPYAVKNGRKTGVSYTSYHPRAKYVKLSFDQTITSEDMHIRYDTCYSSNLEALKMWNNEGKLVISVMGAEKAITTDGDMTDTNRIDWILEFCENEEEPSKGGLIQYVFCNGKFVAEGKIGDHYATRLNNIQLYAKTDAEVIIENWSMTLYNENAEYDVITKDFNFGGDEPVDPPVEILYGDVNNDGTVSAKDPAFLARHLANWVGYEADKINLQNADVDANGTVNAKDPAVLARHLAHWTGYETLPYAK